MVIFLVYFLISYRALDNDVVGGSHIEGFPIWAITVLTKHDRGRSIVMAESNEEKKNVGHESANALYTVIFGSAKLSLGINIL